MSQPNQPEAAEAAVAPDAVKLADGAIILKEWLGEGGIPVAQNLAQSRADVCLKHGGNGCPANARKTMWSWLSVPVANTVLRWIEHKNKMNLHVDGEENLGTCSACLCELTVKIWCPMKHIQEHSDPRVIEQMPSHCWVKSEINQP